MTTTTDKRRHYGWKPQLPDFRDWQFTVSSPQPLKSVYLFDNHNSPPVYDQGQLGSCTANGLAGAVEFWEMNKGDKPDPTAELFMPSRLFIYYYERLAEGTIMVDSGASIRDGIQVLAGRGVPSETLWPYDISKFTQEPPAKAIAEAVKFEILEYYAVDNTNKSLIVNALLTGHPIVFGFTVYESFESQVVATTGIVPMPKRGEEILGGHCVCIWGYNLEGDYFLCRNSWGTDWGLEGYFRMPAAYITNPNLASDFWVIRSVKSAA